MSDLSLNILIVFTLSLVILFFGLLKERFKRENIRKDTIKDYEKKSIDILEREKSLVAMDIHDSIQTKLTQTGQMLDKTALNFSDSNLAIAQALLKSAVKELKIMTRELKPIQLQDEKLKRNIVLLIAEAADARDLKLDIHIDDFKVKKELEINIFRIVQEAFNNILKHAHKADRVSIHINQSAKYIIGNIKDNGVGFEPKLALNKESYGIKNMRERAVMMRGEFKIHSHINQGTEIYFKLPIS